MTTTPSQGQHSALPPDVPISQHGEVRNRLRATASAAAAYALLLALLVLVIFLEDHSVLVPLVVLSAVGLVAAVVTATVQRRWTAWPVVIYALVVLAADGPHQIPAIVHPESLPHAVGGVILIIAGLATLVIAVRAAVKQPTSGRTP